MPNATAHMFFLRGMVIGYAEISPTTTLNTTFSDDYDATVASAHYTVFQSAIRWKIPRWYFSPEHSLSMASSSSKQFHFEDDKDKDKDKDKPQEDDLSFRSRIMRLLMPCSPCTTADLLHYIVFLILDIKHVLCNIGYQPPVTFHVDMHPLYVLCDPMDMRRTMVDMCCRVIFENEIRNLVPAHDLMSNTFDTKNSNEEEKDCELWFNTAILPLLFLDETQPGSIAVREYVNAVKKIIVLNTLVNMQYFIAYVVYACAHQDSTEYFDLMSGSGSGNADTIIHLMMYIRSKRYMNIPDTHPRLRCLNTSFQSLMRHLRTVFAVHPQDDLVYTEIFDDNNVYTFCFGRENTVYNLADT
jgi:hypothetical protein